MAFADFGGFKSAGKKDVHQACSHPSWGPSSSKGGKSGMGRSGKGKEGGLRAGGMSWHQPTRAPVMSHAACTRHGPMCRADSCWFPPPHLLAFSRAAVVSMPQDSTMLAAGALMVCVAAVAGIAVRRNRLAAGFAEADETTELMAAGDSDALEYAVVAV